MYQPRRCEQNGHRTFRGGEKAIRRPQLVGVHKKRRRATSRSEDTEGKAAVLFEPKTSDQAMSAAYKINEGAGMLCTDKYFIRRGIS